MAALVWDLWELNECILIQQGYKSDRKPCIQIWIVEKYRDSPVVRNFALIHLCKFQILASTFTEYAGDFLFCIYIFFSLRLC